MRRSAPMPNVRWLLKPSEMPERIMSALRADERRTVRELQSICGASSTSVIEYHITRLELDGMLTRGKPGASRTLRLTAKGRGKRTPDEELLARCLVFLEEELEAVGGALIDDLKLRLG